MNIYLASQYSRREELCGYRAQLWKLGHEVPARWLNGVDQINTEGQPLKESGEQLVEDGAADVAAELRQKFALDDFEDVQSCDLLVAFTEIPRTSTSRGGRHVELGLALGTGKPVVIIGPRENIFCWLPVVSQFDTFENFFATVKPG